MYVIQMTMTRHELKTGCNKSDRIKERVALIGRFGYNLSQNTNTVGCTYFIVQ